MSQPLLSKTNTVKISFNWPSCQGHRRLMSAKCAVPVGLTSVHNTLYHVLKSNLGYYFFLVQYEE